MKKPSIPEKTAGLEKPAEYINTAEQGPSFNKTMEGLPSYMIAPDCCRWLLWRKENHGKSKPIKKPYYSNGKPRSGKLDTPEDLAQLVTFKEAYKVLQLGDFSGLGFALGPDGNGGHWQGIDLDDVADHPQLQSLILPGYVEKSPSKKGLHAIGYGSSFPSLGSNGSGSEAYSYGRYFTVTGEAIGGTSEEVVDLSNYVEQYLLPLHSKRPSKSSDTLTSPLNVVSEVTPKLLKDLGSALESISSDPYDDWVAMGHALCKLGDDGLNLWTRWSTTSKKFDLKEALAHWQTFTGDRTSYRAVFACAQRNGWVNPNKKDKKLNATELEASSTWIKVNIADIFTNPAQPLIFPIADLLPEGEVTLLSAHGGTGKSLLSLQAAVCLAMGISFMGKDVKQSRVIFYSAEDPNTILQYRLANICKFTNISPSDLTKNLRIIDVTNDPSLYHETLGNDRKATTTECYQKLSAEIETFNADVLIIDNVSDVFDANENIRSHVRGFMRALKLLGKKHRTAILLLAHIDKQSARGFNNTDVYSGSTAWHNSSRSRLTLTRCKENEQILLLEQHKSNHGKLSNPIHLAWHSAGVFVSIEPPSEHDIVATIIKLLFKLEMQGKFVSPSPHSPYHAFELLHNHPEFPSSIYTKKILTPFLEKMERSGKLIRQTIPTASRGKTREVYKLVSSAPSSELVLITPEHNPYSQ